MLVMLKRVLPFVLTLLVGLLLASLLGPAAHRQRKLGFTLSESNGRRCVGGKEGLRNDAPLRIAYKPVPLYTAEARQHGTRGIVELRMLLRADGTVAHITPIRELPYGLTDEAVRAAEEIEFTPAIVMGQPTDTIQFVEFEFSPR
jgi:hypothetical protein